VHKKKKEGKSQIFAAEIFLAQVVRLLLDRGAIESINSTTEWLGTPLHSACEWARYTVVPLLIQAGED
jgi:ankyrin repeat protein